MNGTSATAGVRTATFTLDMLKEAAIALAALGEEPIKAYMKREGFDPESGGILIMPESLRGYFGPWGAPIYVRFSKIIEAPVMFKDSMHEFREAVRNCRYSPGR